jgi:HEAT repeat protein
MLWWNIRQLRSKKRDSRKRAAERLSRSRNGRAVDPLIEALKDEYYLVRRAAVAALERVDDERVIEPLMNAVSDWEPGVQCAAVTALGRQKDKRSIETLIGALKDEYLQVRKAAAQALEQMPYARAVEPLIDALRDWEPTVREAAAKALVRIGSPAVESLALVLKFCNRELRTLAAEALGEIKDERAIEPLMIALKDEDQQVREAAAKALNLLKWQPADDGQRVLSLLARDSQHTSIFKETDAELLIAMLKADRVFLRRKAANQLGRIKAERAFEPLVSSLKDPNRSVREAAAEALGQMPDARAIKPLIDALRDSDGGVRQAAAAALVEFGNAAVQPLVEALEDDNSDARMSAASALESLEWKREDHVQHSIFAIARQRWSDAVQWHSVTQNEHAAARIIELLISALDDRDAAVRHGAAKALGEIKDERAIEPLAARLKDADSDVRRVVVKALGLLGWRPADDEQRAALAVTCLIWSKSIFKGPDDSLLTWEQLQNLGAAAVGSLLIELDNANNHRRAKVLEALENIGESAREPLLLALNDERWLVRKAAALRLNALGWQPSDDNERTLLDITLGKWDQVASRGVVALELLTLALNDTGDDIKRKAVKILRQIKDARAVEPLIAALKNEDWQVRLEAAKGLAEIKDVRAIEPLSAALRDRDDSVRRSALSSLITYDNAHIEERLCAALMSEDRLTRNEAVLAFWKKGAAGVEPLIIALKDESSEVRLFAASALLENPDARAIEPLAYALRDINWGVRTQAAKALGSIGGARVAGYLSVALKDEHKAVRKAALTALYQFKDARVESLLAALDDEESDVRNIAASLLELLGWEPASDGERARHAIAKLRWEQAVSLGPAAIEPLIAALKDKESAVRKAAADALGLLNWQPQSDYHHALLAVANQQWERVKSFGVASIGPLIAALKDEDKNIRHEAARTLDGLGRNILSPAQRALCLIAMGSWSKAQSIGKDAVKPLIAALGSQDKSVRQHAISSLGGVPHSEAVKPLVTLLKDGDDDARLSAAKALWQIRYARAVEPLALALKDESSEVRKTAAAALGTFSDKRAEGLLLTLLDHADLDVRKSAITALGGIKSERAIQPLLKAVKDVSLSRVATTALACIADAAIAPLIAALRGDDRWAREAAEEALGMIGEPAIIPMTTVLSDREESVRLAAVRVLREIASARIRDCISDSLEKYPPDMKRQFILMQQTLAAEPLAAALKDAGWKVREAAQEAMKDLEKVAAEAINAHGG